MGALCTDFLACCIWFAWPMRIDSWLPAQVPLRRIAALNKPELPAALTGLAGSAALGMMMPGGLACRLASHAVLHVLGCLCYVFTGCCGARNRPAQQCPACKSCSTSARFMHVCYVLCPAGFSIAFSSMLSVFYNPDPCEWSAYLFLQRLAQLCMPMSLPCLRLGQVGKHARTDAPVCARPPCPGLASS